MTDNEILARWQGWKFLPRDDIWAKPEKLEFAHFVPDYPNDPAACMSLLGTLVEKGYYPEVFYCLGRKWNCTIALDGNIIAEAKSLNPNEAIIAACLEVARKEQGNV